VAIELPPQHALYWRCGACRKVNGRPAYARGFRAGCANCGVCAFYASRITHGCALQLRSDRFAFKKPSRKLQLANVEPCRFISWSLF